MIRKIWTLWAKSLGDKSSELNRDADIIATMRTIIVLVNFITCLFIVSNITNIAYVHMFICITKLHICRLDTGSGQVLRADLSIIIL